jgi:hypothetical protein
MIYRPKNTTLETEVEPVEGEGKELHHNYGHRGAPRYYHGKPREENHPFDRRSGTGRGYELKKGGHGRGNWGTDKPIYKKKGESAED